MRANSPNLLTRFKSMFRPGAPAGTAAPTNFWESSNFREKYAAPAAVAGRASSPSVGSFQRRTDFRVTPTRVPSLAPTSMNVERLYRGLTPPKPEVAGKFGVTTTARAAALPEAGPRTTFTTNVLSEEGVTPGIRTVREKRRLDDYLFTWWDTITTGAARTVASISHGSPRARAAWGFINAGFNQLGEVVRHRMMTPQGMIQTISETGIDAILHPYRLSDVLANHFPTLPSTYQNLLKSLEAIPEIGPYVDEQNVRIAREVRENSEFFKRWFDERGGDVPFVIPSGYALQGLATQERLKNLTKDWEEKYVAPADEARAAADEVKAGTYGMATDSPEIRGTQEMARARAIEMIEAKYNYDPLFRYQMNPLFGSFGSS